MILSRRGFAFRLSLVNWYIAGIMGWLMMSAWSGVFAGGDGSRAIHPDPVAIGFILIGCVMIAIALDGTIVLRAQGDTIEVIGVFRRVRLQRSTCRCVVQKYGRLRDVSYGLVLDDGTRKRGISRYWLWGSFLAWRVSERLERDLLA